MLNRSNKISSIAQGCLEVWGMQKPHALVLLLPDADRQVLETVFFDGKTSVEIGEERDFRLTRSGADFVAICLL
jgi:hypothetical protein